jgi:malonyl CoA-acyl carrier protein transacylase/NAD(P)-dependent dehydrogenase (short-subunit alcohol dehydrogenase family)
MGKELYERYVSIRRWMDCMAAVADFDLLNLLFKAGDDELRKTRWQQPALFTMEYAMARHLLSLGVTPVAMAGHSLGELVALSLAGVFSDEDAFRIVDKRAQCMDRASRLHEDPGTMIAVEAPLELLKEKLGKGKNLYFTNYNSPRQVVIGGGTKAVLGLKDELAKEGFWSVQLRVSMAFHSPIMNVIRDELEEFLSGIVFHPPTIPVISNATMERYPDDPGEIRKVLLAQLESPVHWMQDVNTLWKDYGVRLFVEVGPRGTLCNLIAETLEGVQCIPVNQATQEADSYRRAVAKLYASGHLKQVKKLEQEISPDSAHPFRPVEDPAVRDRVKGLIEREIHSFVMETFGKFLKPSILDAVRREVDSSFTEERLEALLHHGHIPGSPSGCVTTDPAPGPLSAISTPVSTESEIASSPPKENLTDSSGKALSDLERVIRIIMAATGYERHEIEPDMDIRQDLAIRSSRLPVIIDMAERQFGITIKLENFIGLRTVRDFASRISELAQARQALPLQEPTAGPEVPALPVEPYPASSPAERPVKKEPIKRLIFEQVPLDQAPMKCLNIKEDADIAVLTLGEADLADELINLLKAKWKGRPLRFDLSKEFDLRTQAGVEAGVKQLSEAQSLTGFVVVIDEKASVPDIAEVPALLTGYFRLLQVLMHSSAKAFCLLIQRHLDASAPAAIVADGLEGMFLSAALEYPSVLFRCVALDRDTELSSALDHALDTNINPVRMEFRGPQAFTQAAKVHPIPISSAPGLRLVPGDVVVVSGGGRGVTSRLALALAPFQPRLVLLGRQELDPDVDYEALVEAADPADEVRRLLKKNRPGLEQKTLDLEASRLLAGVEITRTLRDLARLKVEASYHCCDVTDRRQVSETMEQVVMRHGRIDGIVHGAGVIRDGFMGLMSPADFTRVVEVKLLGGWTLYQLSHRQGLRFFAALSSVVAVTGNLGQVNYCAANRALAAFVSGLCSGSGRVLGKALMLPPIEGAGMADTPEVRELLELKGMGGAYVHVAEISEIFCRELFLGPPTDSWTLWARTLPSVKTARVDLQEPTPKAGEQSIVGVSFYEGDFPMIDACRRLDLEKGELEAVRTFSQKRDLWLEDHRPFRFLKYPLLSGVMAVETALEATRLLHPHLVCHGVRDVRYKDFMEVPPDMDREVRIVCRSEVGAGEVLCRTSLSSMELSPSGRPLDRWCLHFEGEVVLSGNNRSPVQWSDFGIKAEMFDMRAVRPDEVMDWYEKRCGLRGRYLVIEALDGSGPGIVRGRMPYRKSQDFARLEEAQYQYSPYLLEAMMHLVNFYVSGRDREEKRLLVPAGIRELRFTRLCRPDEKVVLEARLQAAHAEGMLWDARGLDEEGKTLMEAEGLDMKWTSEGIDAGQ